MALQYDFPDAWGENSGDAILNYMGSKGRPTLGG